MVQTSRMYNNDRILLSHSFKGDDTTTLSTDPRSVVDALRDAMNAKDHQVLSELFTEDAEFVSINGARLHGRDTIASGHAQIFSKALAETGAVDPC